MTECCGNSTALYPVPLPVGFRVRAGCQEIWALVLPFTPKVTLGRSLPVPSSVKWRWEGHVGLHDPYGPFQLEHSVSSEKQNTLQNAPVLRTII